MNQDSTLLSYKYDQIYKAVLELIPKQERRKYELPNVTYISSNPTWDNYDVALEFYLELAERRYIGKSFNEAIELVEVALDYARKTSEKAKVRELKLKILVTLGRLREAIELGLESLEILDVCLSHERPDNFDVERLEALSDLTNSESLTLLHILKLLGEASYILEPELCISVIWTEFRFCEQYGNSPLAAIAYNDYGLLLCSTYGEIEKGYQLGKLATKLLRKFNCTDLTASILEPFNCNIRHWKELAENALGDLEKAFRLGIETGDFFFAGISAVGRCDVLIFCSKDLEFIEQEYNRYFHAFELMGLEYPVLYGKAGCYLIRVLQGKASQLDLDVIQGNQTALFAAYLAELILDYCFNRLTDAIAHAQQAQLFLEAVPGQIVVAQYNFYYSLALLAAYPGADEVEGQRLLVQVAANQDQLATWAYHAPMNFQHRFDLVEAERQRLTGGRDAISLYFSAIEGAEAWGYVADWALACERLAVAWIELRELRLAQQYLQRARQGYLQWGAVALANQILQRYGESIWDLTVEAIAGSTATEAIRVFILSQQEGPWRRLLEVAEWEIAADVVTLRVSSPEMALAVRSQLQQIVLPKGIELRVVSDSR